ncbi:MAG: hypothetical protein IBX69_19070 [Anaerolineales bacterium]|nr:hypothetical protein [Anaerolineales bacterium]
MVALRQWLRRYKHVAHLIAFLMIMIPSAVLYPLAQHEATGLIWVLISVIVAGNVLVVSMD